MATVTPDAIFNEATSVAHTLLQDALKKTPHARAITVLNFTRYEWSIVHDVPSFLGTDSPSWERAPVGLSPYNAGGGGSIHDAHQHGSNYSVSVVKGLIPAGVYQYFFGFPIFYNEELGLNLVTGAGLLSHSLLTQELHNTAMAAFLPGSMMETTRKLEEAHREEEDAIWPFAWGMVHKDREDTFFKQKLGEFYDRSFGHPEVITSGEFGLKVSFTAAEETMFIIEYDD